MKTSLRPALPFFALLLLAGCMPPPMYDWGEYEQSLYNFYRNTNTDEEYVAALAKICEAPADQAMDQTASKGTKVPGPGLHAEYGFALMERQRFAEAVHHFEAEKRQWPESTPFMDVLIRLAKDEGPKDKGKSLLAPQDTGAKPAKPVSASPEKKKDKRS